MALNRGRAPHERGGGPRAVSPPGAAQARRGRDAGRRPDGPAVRRRAHQGLDLHPILQRRLRLEAGVVGGDHEREIIFIGRDDADGRRAAELALAVGVRNIAGLLAGGHDQLAPGKAPGRAHRAHGGPTSWRARMGEGTDLQLLDVRERSEWDAGARPRVGLSSPGTTSGGSRRGSTPSGRSRWSAPGACARRRRPACSSSMAPTHVIHVIDGGDPDARPPRRRAGVRHGGGRRGGAVGAGPWPSRRAC